MTLNDFVNLGFSVNKKLEFSVYLNDDNVLDEYEQPELTFHSYLLPKAILQEKFAKAQVENFYCLDTDKVAVVIALVEGK